MGVLILTVVSAALIAGIACNPAVSSAREDEDWYIMNADGRSGKIIGTEMGYDPAIMNLLLGKPYFSTAKIVYYDGTSYAMGGIYEIGIAENADLTESLKDLKNLLGNIDEGTLFHSLSQILSLEVGALDDKESTVLHPLRIAGDQFHGTGHIGRADAAGSQKALMKQKLIIIPQRVLFQVHTTHLLKRCAAACRSG
jgi:hypothetical protein